MTADFIGAGWNFPLGVDATSRVGLARQARDIEQAIEIILRTAPGERPMRPEFGCRIQDHLFSPTNSATAAAIAARRAGRAGHVGAPHRRRRGPRRLRPASTSAPSTSTSSTASAATTTNATWSSRSTSSPTNRNPFRAPTYPALHRGERSLTMLPDTQPRRPNLSGSCR